MKARAFALGIVAALAFGTAAAQHEKVVDGIVVRLGIVPAAKLAQFPGEAMHASELPSGSQHVLITLADVRNGTPVEATSVVVRVTDPKGAAQSKQLVAARTVGAPDYSETFTFGWSGRYRIHVTVEPKAGKAVDADFVWMHVV
jgi:hypothetical protein